MELTLKAYLVRWLETFIQRRVPHYVCRLRLERDEALGKAEGLDTELTRNKAAGSHSLLFLKDDLKKKDEEKKTLTQQNKEQRQRVISLERQLK